MNNNKPLFSHRLNRVEVAIWKNESDNNIWHNITFHKSYRDSEGEMQSTTNLRMVDLPALGFLADKAYDFLASLEQLCQFRRLSLDVSRVGRPSYQAPNPKHGGP